MSALSNPDAISVLPQRTHAHSRPRETAQMQRLQLHDEGAEGSKEAHEDPYGREAVRLPVVSLQGFRSIQL